MTDKLLLPTRRVIAVLTALALMSVVFVTGTATSASASATSTEASVTSMVNKSRTWRGGHRLITRSDLVTVARGQARRMAASNRLYHNPSLGSAVTNWRWVGENVGYGPDVTTVHAAFMASPGHKANILDTDYTEIGVGAVTVNGRVWIAQVFRKPMHAMDYSHPTLRYGSRGTAVQLVQMRIGVRASGTFGRVAKAKIVAFQLRQGWSGSGIVGPYTWRALGI